MHWLTSPHASSCRSGAYSTSTPSVTVRPRRSTRNAYRIEHLASSKRPKTVNTWNETVAKELRTRHPPLTEGYRCKSIDGHGAPSVPNARTAGPSAGGKGSRRMLAAVACASLTGVPKTASIFHRPLSRTIGISTSLETSSATAAVAWFPTRSTPVTLGHPALRQPPPVAINPSTRRASLRQRSGAHAPCGRAVSAPDGSNACRSLRSHAHRTHAAKPRSR
jgi:hypothetical protein